MAAAPLGVALGFLARGTGRISPWTALAAGALLGALIECAHLLLASGVSQGMSVITRGLGMAWGLSFATAFRRDWLIVHRSKLRPLVILSTLAYLAITAATLGLFSAKVEPLWMATQKLTETRFLPFYYHFTTETEAMRSLLTNAGMYLPVGLLVWMWHFTAKNRSEPTTAIVIASALALLVEASKLFLAGKKPDPTNIVIAATAAGLCWSLLDHLWNSYPATNPSSHPAAQTKSPKTPGMGSALTYSTLVLIAIVGVSSTLLGRQSVERPVDETSLAQLPPGTMLPPVTLPAFRAQHPRLPHPDGKDISLLRRYNPGSLLSGRF